MKKAIQLFLLFLMVFVFTANSQNTKTAPKLFIGGGALPETMYKEFLKLTGPNAKLVVVPTASSLKIDVQKMQALWLSRGFKEIHILHTRDKNIANSTDFAAPLKTATAVWFNGGSQIRIADAYLGTTVEKELYNLIQRGGVIGGSSAGAAIQTKIMIVGGKDEPKIATGFDLLPAIIDQHFLKRNRLARLSKAVKDHPEMLGFGIDEATAIVVNNNTYKVVGSSYVLRFEMVNGTLKIDAFENGEEIPMKKTKKE
ncbi:cyanophycinase [Polaribacter uvawellassae]|uniref:cyanophycinase n=1 Tax=Polaribacter uvawellassae TaxID=3133495 RepID=UPI00321901DF